MGMLRFLFRLFATKPKSPRPVARVSSASPVVRGKTVVVLDRPAPQPVAPKIIKGPCWVIDGDTIVFDKIHIRLAGIDAPELDHPFGQKAKWAMVQLCRGQIVTAHIKPELAYDRMVAQCFLPDGRDLAAELVKQGMALDWTKFSGGAYKHLETTDARQRLWRAATRPRSWTPPQIPD